MSRSEPAPRLADRLAHHAGPFRGRGNTRTEPPVSTTPARNDGNAATLTAAQPPRADASPPTARTDDCVRHAQLVLQHVDQAVQALFEFGDAQRQTAEQEANQTPDGSNEYTNQMQAALRELEAAGSRLNWAIARFAPLAREEPAA